MSVFFCNKSTIDLDVIRIMGVSVKENDNPIGYFGTGLKFAIATLLRTGHKIELLRDGVSHPIGTTRKTIRGESFDVVTLDGEPLGFMTQLGRNWKPWMAYRELHSNCLDEGGVISDRMPGGEWGTVIRVDGDGITDAYRDRGSIFLETDPLSISPTCDIHSGSGCVGFFRGIQAIKLNNDPAYLYNVKSGVSLTEDRTVTDQFSYNWEVARSILQCEREDILERILIECDDRSYESTLPLLETHQRPSEVFMRVCEPYAGGYKILPNAKKVYEKFSKKEIVPEVVEPDALSVVEIDRALSLLRRLNCNMSIDDFSIVESLGAAYGMVSKGEILIARKTLERGDRFIASTLYEEWLHKTQGLKDESRDLQDLLLDRLFHFVAVTEHYESEAKS